MTKRIGLMVTEPAKAVKAFGGAIRTKGGWRRTAMPKALTVAT
jgi:hypothetical protein